MIEPRSFGEWVRRERERRGISIQEIADRTKIGSMRLHGLERGDVSSWPGGLYRRAFVRAYAGAIGLDADLVVERFLVAFPDADDTTPSAAASPRRADGSAPLRLHLAEAPAHWTPAVKTACFDVAFALVIGLLGLAAAGAVGFWCATGVAALVHHVRGILAGGRPGSRTSTQEAPAGLAALAVWFESLKQKVMARASVMR